jgi:hypothetical protein
MHSIDFQTANIFIDPARSNAALGYEMGGLDEALMVTVEACLN